MPHSYQKPHNIVTNNGSFSDITQVNRVSLAIFALLRVILERAFFRVAEMSILYLRSPFKLTCPVERRHALGKDWVDSKQ